MSTDQVEIPTILLMGRRGSNIKIWAFLRVNEGQWFTAREIAQYLNLPLSTVQLALRRIHLIAPLIHCDDIITDTRGRPEKRYKHQKLLTPP